MVKAVIFDVDGTLIDSVDLHARAWQEIFLKYGVRTDFQAVRDQIGKGGDKLMRVFLSEEQIARQGKEIEEQRAKLFVREYLPLVKPFPALQVSSSACERMESRSRLPRLPGTRNLRPIRKSPVSNRFWRRIHHRMTCRIASRTPTSF